MTEADTAAAAPGGAAATPPITLTVSTVQGWPDIETAILTVIRSAEAVGGDVVVADGSGHPPPTPADVGASVQWLSHPGESVFQLRERAYEASRGDIVAVTEDHVHVPLEWAQQLIDAHRRHPEAAAIGGSVLNGATDYAMDWASFLIVQAAVAAPIKSGPAGRLSGAVNVAYKRSAIEGMKDYRGLGAMDGLHQRELARRGATVLNDDSIRVSHVQSLGFVGTTLINFHAGRTISGFRRREMTPVDGLRIVGAPFVPLARFARVMALLTPRGYGPVLARSAPAILFLLYSQGVGQLVGYLFGESDSPRKVQ